MRTIFEWLDAHPGFFWLPALLATTALLGWIALGVRAAAQARSFRHSDWVFAVLLLLFLAAWRWPYFLAASEYNPDESQFIAGAMALAEDPVFWRSVDGVTSGPLDFYVLLPLHWLGLPLDYFTARVTALLLTWGTLLFIQRSFRAAAPPGVAQLAVLPGAVFFATATAADFVHYSSELAPLALLALAVSQIERRPLAAAFVAGCLPWAKLQAAPLAVAVVGWQLWQVWKNRPAGGPRPWRRGATLVGFAAAPSLLGVILVAAFGQFGHFYRRYFLQNVAYVQGGMPFDKVVQDMARFTRESGHFYPWLWATLLLLGLLGLIYFRQQAKPPPQVWRDLTVHARGKGFIVASLWTGLLFLLGAGTTHVLKERKLPPTFWLGAALTLMAVVCIVAPARSSLHYLLFLTVPLTVWTGVLLCDLWESGNSRRLLTGLAFLCALAPFNTRAGQSHPDMIGHLSEHWRQPYTALGQVLRHWQQPGARMALWGWMSSAYVEGGLPQATQDTVSQWCILEVPQREYYRATFLSDMQRTRPEVFVDAVGPGSPFFYLRATQAHEIYPALADHVRQHYRLVIDLNHARVYVRADILEQQPLTASELKRLVGLGRRDYGMPAPPDVTTPAKLPGNRINEQAVLMIEPPAELLWRLTGTERSIRLNFGFHPKAYTEGATDGAEFIAELRMPGQPPLQVFHRLLEPRLQPGDRGPLSAEVDLSPFPADTVLVVRTTAGKRGNNAWDWVYLSGLRIAHSPFYFAGQFPGFRRTPHRVDSAYPYLIHHDGERLLMLPPPSALTFVLEGNEQYLGFAYGLQREAYTGPGQTDGATFQVELHRDGEATRTLFARNLYPLGVEADRGRQFAELSLPADIRAGDRLVVSIDPGAGTSWDWTYLAALDLH
jgi:hypothetical protein